MTAALACAAALVALGWALRLRRRLALVALAAHEVRAPATVVCLAVERMRAEPGARRHARALEVEVDRLRAGLRDLEAARAGRRAGAEPDVVSAERFARGAMAGWAGHLRAEGRPVALDWRAGRAVLRGDRGRLAQALGNLLANAAEHGRGAVRMRARRDERALRLEVENRAPGGAVRAGTGLRVARAAAHELGGAVHVDREADRVVATLELPLDEERPAA